MHIARITAARFKQKFMYLQSEAMAVVSRPKAIVFSGPTNAAPSSECTVCEEDNSEYGRVLCPELFKTPASPGGLPELPLQLNDEVQYEVKAGAIYLHSIQRQGTAATPARPRSQSPQGGQLLEPAVLGARKCRELVSIGFENVAQWVLDGSTIMHKGDDPATWEHLVSDFPQALYAFCVDEEPKYIGKTVSTIRARFQGYRSPGNTQATNRRCNEGIVQVLQAGKTVRILVLPNRTPLMWGRFPINVAAGLEDALIDAFQPDWNA